jgi:hypothetical protein
MSRQAKGKLIVSTEQFEWVVRVIARRLKRIDMVKSARLTDVVVRFHDKLMRMITDDKVKNSPVIVLPANRNELRVLQDIARAEYNGLVTTIVPGYMEKMEKNAAFYEPYKVRAEKTAHMILDIVNKIEGVLE